MDIDKVPEETLRKKFYDVLTWYFSEKAQPTGFYSTIGRIDEKLGKLEGRFDTLNSNLQKLEESSTNLSKALNKITLVGVIISGIAAVILLIKFFVDVL